MYNGNSSFPEEGPTPVCLCWVSSVGLRCVELNSWHRGGTIERRLPASRASTGKRGGYWALVTEAALLLLSRVCGAQGNLVFSGGGV